MSVSYGGATDISELQYLDLGYSQVLDAEGLKLFADVSDSWGGAGHGDLAGARLRLAKPLG